MTIQGFYDTIPPEGYTERFIFNLRPFTNIQEEKGKIEQAFGISQEQIQDNVYLLAAMGQSGILTSWPCMVQPLSFSFLY